MKLTTRFATEKDVPLILDFIRALAVFEKLEHEMVATEDSLRKSLFGPRPYAEVLIGEANQEPVAFALFFHNYSTFLGKPGLYLEDLFVRENCRSNGYGKIMLQRLAQIAEERGCGRFEWWVLDWNKNAIRFYENIGAQPMSEWTVYRLTGAPLKALASK